MAYMRDTHPDLLDGFLEYLRDPHNGYWEDVEEVLALWGFSEYLEEVCECCGPQWDFGVRFRYITKDGDYETEELFNTHIEEIEEWIEENK